LINTTPASSASGIYYIKKNIGSLENKGIELDLNLVPIKTNDFKWTLNTNFSSYNTKILSITGSEGDSVFLSGYSTVGSYAVVGESFPILRGYVFNRNDNGNIIVNSDGTPQISATAEHNLGKVTPDFIMGLTNSFEYKGIKLTAVIDYRQGGKVYSSVKNMNAFSGNEEWTGEIDRNNYVWPNTVTTTGAVNTTPINYATLVNYMGNGTYRNIAEAFIIDATAIRVRELSLGYTIPSSLSKDLGIRSLSFSVNARNPFFVFAKDNRLYTDPEASTTSGNGQGIAPIDRYPNVKSYGFALNLTF
jgi:hypothetical protein